MATRRSVLRLGAVVLFLLALGAIKVFRGGGEGLLPKLAPHGASAAGAAALDRAFADQRSNLQVTVAAEVERVLPDDRKGSPHQRFLIRLPSALSVLVAHNLDLAPRVPLAVGDTVEIAGEYEWNEKGGVLHWTHHDPKHRHAGGYIRLHGQEYR